MQTPELVSVIVPTFNGENKIPLAISSLAFQTILPAEVVVVVDGSTDNTLQVLGELSAGFSRLRIKVVVQANSGRASAKNRGIAEAASELLVFLDDDMEPVPTWLESHIMHHRKIIGSIASGSLNSPHSDLKTDLQYYQAWLHRRWHPFACSTKPIQISEPYIHGGNFSAHKSTLSIVGNFCPGLTDCEDRLLALTSLDKDVPLYLLPGAQCTHHDTHCSTFVRLGQRARQYEEARSSLVIHSPSFLRYPAFQPFQPKIATSWIYHLFRHRLFLRAADLGLFRFMPSCIRFPFYSMIVTAHSRI